MGAVTNGEYSHKRTNIERPREVRVLKEITLRELDDVRFERGLVRVAAVGDDGYRLVAHPNQRASVRVHELLDERAPDEADAAQDEDARFRRVHRVSNKILISHKKVLDCAVNRVIYLFPGEPIRGAQV